MVRSYFEVGKEERLAGGTFTAAVRLNGHEHRIDLVQRLLVVGLQDPPFFGKVSGCPQLRTLSDNPDPSLAFSGTTAYGQWPNAYLTGTFTPE